MFILRIIRYIKGYILFSASGNFVERFINLIARNQISIWGTKKKGKYLCSNVSVKDYEKLLNIAKQTETSIEIEKEVGVPYKKKKYKKRKGLAVGIVFFVLFIFAMSNFIWSIEITGNEDVPQEKIFDALENVGVKVGTYIGGIDFDIMQQKVMLQLDGVAWMGYILDGTRLTIEVREEIEAPELVGKKEPCNVVAKKTGVITKLSVYEGSPEAKVGDTVMAGDLIVNAIITTKKGNSVNHARAEVIARIEDTVEFPVLMDQTLPEYTGNEQEKKFIGILDKKFSLLSKKIQYDLFDIETDKRQINVFGIDIPIYIYNEKYKEYNNIDIHYDEQQAKAEAMRMKSEYIQENYSDAVIISDDMDRRIDNGTYILIVNFVYEEDIGVEQPLLINDPLIR